MIKSNEVDIFRRILLIDRFDVFKDAVGYIRKLFVVVPLFVEDGKIGFGCGGRKHVDYVVHFITSLASQLGSRKLIERQIDIFRFLLDMKKTAHLLLR